MNEAATTARNNDCDSARSSLLKLSTALIVCTALTACGGSDNPVASDSATQPTGGDANAGAGGDTTDTTAGTGGDTAGSTVADRLATQVPGPVTRPRAAQTTVSARTH